MWSTPAIAGAGAGPGGAASDGGAARDLVFARQRVPDAVEVRAPSVQRLAEAAYQVTEAVIDAGDAPFTLARLAGGRRPDAGQPRRAGRDGSCWSCSRRGGGAHFVRTARRRRSARAGRRARGWCSWSRSSASACWCRRRPRERLPRGGTDLAPWPAGSAPIALDKAPPSRAYQKLEEAFAWLGDGADRRADLRRSRRRARRLGADRAQARRARDRRSIARRWNRRPPATRA